MKSRKQYLTEPEEQRWLTIRGWVEGVGEREATFYLQAHDEHEKVCERTLRLVVVRRTEFARRIDRKCETIARRERLFVA